MPSFRYRVENDSPTRQSVFEFPRGTPQPSSYLDIPLAPVQLDLSTYIRESADSSQNARRKKQGCKSGSLWSYSQLDTGRANKSEPMYKYDLERNDDSSSESDTPPPPKPIPHPDTPNYGALDDEMTLVKTPSPSFLHRLNLIKPLRKHPFSRHYEVPEWRSLINHTFLCFLSYPVLLAFVKIAEGRTLFWTRVVVGIDSGVTGVLLGRSLLLLSVRHLEATTWATIIHQSQNHESQGVRFKDIARHVDDPMSAINGIRLLRDRFMYSGTARQKRAHYDTRPWSIHTLFFLIAFALSVVLPFSFGRIVDITTQIQMQVDKSRYTEVAINGDISDTDNERASALNDSVFDNLRLIWTLTSFSSHGGLPVVEFPSIDAKMNRSDSVYFSQPTKAQLQPGGRGRGTFEREVIALGSSVDTPTSISTMDANMAPGNIIRQPQWGIRNKCAKIPDAQNNILPMSRANFTYVFIPKDTVASLFDYYGKPFPTDLPTADMKSGDQQWPSNVNQSNTFRAVPFEQNGVTLSYYSKPQYGMGADGSGFVSLELGLIRLNTSYAPQGQFPVLGAPAFDPNGTATHIGYDAVVCIEPFEPWIVEAYNSSIGMPTL